MKTSRKVFYFLLGIILAILVQFFIKPIERLTIWKNQECHIDTIEIFPDDPGAVVTEPKE